MDTQPSLLRRLDETGIPLLVARFIVGGMFIWMGAHKIGDPFAFLKLIRLYEMVPDNPPALLNAMAIFLPWLEVFGGAMLIAGIAVRGTSVLFLAMLAVFTFAVFTRAMDIYHVTGQAFCAIKFDCGCGGGEQYICKKLPENIGLALLSIITLVSQSRRYCTLKNIVPAEPLPFNIEGY